MWGPQKYISKTTVDSKKSFIGGDLSNNANSNYNGICIEYIRHYLCGRKTFEGSLVVFNINF